MIRRPRARRALRASAKASVASSARASSAPPPSSGVARRIRTSREGAGVADSLSPTGADHMEAPHDPLYAEFHPQGHPTRPLGLIEPLDPLDLDARRVRAFFETQKVWSSYNSVGMCDFVGAPLNGLEFQPMLDYINAVTGWNMRLYERMKVGERTNTLAQMFNVREGFTPDNDVLPQQMHEGMATVR